MSSKQGGLRSPAGGRPRKEAAEKTTKHTISLYQHELDYLATIHPNLTKAIRTLIEDRRARRTAHQPNTEE